MTVNDSFRKYPFRQRMNLIDVVASDHGIDMHLETPPKHRFQDAKHARTLNRLVEISGHTAHAVVGVPDSIERDVDVQFQSWIVLEATLGDFVNPPRLESVCRKIDVPNPVLRNEKIDNILQIAAKRRFTAAEPEVRQFRHAFGKFDDFLPLQISGAIQLIPVEAGVTGGIAMGSYEKDQSVQFSAAPRYTSVRLGEMSLYRICRHVMLRVNADRIRLYSNNSAVSGANRI